MPQTLSKCVEHVTCYSSSDPQAIKSYQPAILLYLTARRPTVEQSVT